MKSTSIATLCCLVLLTTACHSQGIGHGVELRFTSQKMIEVEPGRIVTGSLMISNKTSRDIEIVESLTLPTIPEGWQPVIDYEGPIYLGAGEETLRLITLLVPSKCPAGRYDIIYSLTDLRGSEALALETFSVVVLPVIKLDAVIEEKPEIVVAGDEYRVRLRLLNNGNSATSLLMQAKASPQYPVVIEPAEARLDAGSSQVVHFTVVTDEAITNRTNHILQINALAEVPGYGSASVHRSVFVEILPKIADAIDPRHRVPTAVRFITVGNQDEGGFQVEYTGNGSLDEMAKRKIDFLFRGPDTRDRSIYGLRDELRFRYSDRILGISLGDKLYALTPLSERLAFGRGGEFRLNPGDFEIGSFYMETRWDVPAKKETGLYAGYSSGDIFGIKGNFLHKQKAESIYTDNYEADLYTVQARFEPGPAFNLGLEYGYGYNTNDGESEDLAHRITLDGELSGRIWYTVENTYAGPRFLGYYNDVIYSNGTVSSLVYGNLRSNLSYRIYEYNLDLDPGKSTAPREQSMRGTLSYPFTTGTNISIDYETISREDDLVPAQFDFEEDIWRLGLGQNFKSFSVQTYAEMGVFSDGLLGGAKTDLERYSIYTYYRPSSRQNVSFYARIGHNSFTGNPERTVSAGASASLHLGNRVNWSFSYQGNNLSSDELPRQDHLLSTVDVLLPNKHSIMLKARWFNFENIDREDYSFFAAYTIPLELPAMKKTSIGSLKGRVVDIHGAEAFHDRKIVLTAGDYITTTDGNGAFTFPPMKPGVYALQPDQRSIGLHTTTTEQLPLQVEIGGGETTYQEIVISTACAISGRVVLLVTAPGTPIENEYSTSGNEIFLMGNGDTRSGQFQKEDLVEAYGLDRILIEISNGKEAIRRRTDQNGSFSFGGIRPGTWRVDVCDEGLPPYHHTEKEQYEIELAGGESYELEVRVLPRLRSVQMIDSGEIEGR
jgi:hypothetical protein